MQNNCPRCGSEKIARGAKLMDRYGLVGVAKLPAEVRVRGKGGLIFFGTVKGALTLDVCGDCGHGDISVSNYREIYEASQLTRKQQR
jgi:hypothetical protein